MSKDKLDNVILNINKRFGKNKIMNMGSFEVEAHPSISTGSLNLDIALGIGGLPKGRIVEIYDPESKEQVNDYIEV